MEGIYILVAVAVVAFGILAFVFLMGALGRLNAELHRLELRIDMAHELARMDREHGASGGGL